MHAASDIASHLVTPRALYSHHGIYIGDGRVVHYAGLAHGWWRGPVEDASLAHSHEAATSEFDAMRPSSILAKWWSVRARDWANAAIGC